MIRSNRGGTSTATKNERKKRQKRLTLQQISLNILLAMQQMINTVSFIQLQSCDDVVLITLSVKMLQQQEVTGEAI